MPFVQLFDMRNDPGEDNNLASRHRDKVRELTALLDQQIANGRSTPGPRLKNDNSKINPFAGVPKFVWGE